MAAAEIVRQGEILYYRADDNNYDHQDEARHAQEVVLGLLAENGRAQEKIQRETRTTDPVRYSLINEPIFWYALLVADRHPVYYHSHHAGGCCGTPDLRGGGSDDGKAVLLAIGVVMLALAFFFSARYTYMHAKEARRAHGAADTTRGYIREHQDARVRNIFERSMAIQERHAKSATAKALSTATITVGVAFLTIATILALYATIRSVPLSSHAHPLFVAGGIFVGGGLVAHGVRAGYNRAYLRGEAHELEELFNQTCDLGVAHPYHVLTNSGHTNAYLHLGEFYFIKRGENYSREQFGTDVTGLTAIEVPEVA